MQSLPLIISLIVAAFVVPPLVRALRDGGIVRDNYRKASLAFPIGTAIPVAALLALIPLALLQEIADLDVFKAAAYPAAYTTAHVSLIERGLLKAGELLLEGDQAAITVPQHGVDLIQGCLYQAALLAQLGVLGLELQRRLPRQLRR